MTVENIKRMLDAFYMAKRIRDMLPLLPEDVAPSYIRYLDIIEKLGKANGNVRVSDLSCTLNIQRPGVTRTVKEMEEKGYLRKTSSGDDARVTYLEITEKGKALSKKYNEEVFTSLIPALSSVSDEDVENLIRTTTIFYRAMCQEEGK
jgi:MarR family transcriptional regulator, organic hydroperoxide resistance regulator